LWASFFAFTWAVVKSLQSSRTKISVKPAFRAARTRWRPGDGRMEEEKGPAGAVLLRLPRSLKEELTKHARREGVSRNQLCVYILAKEVGREGSANPLDLRPLEEVIEEKRGKGDDRRP